MKNEGLRMLTAVVTILGIVAINLLVSREFDGLTPAIFFIVSLFLIVSMGAMAMEGRRSKNTDNDA